MHTQDDIARYLYALSADCTRDSWIEIMSAFKSAGGDYETFRAWSATAPHRFDANNCTSTWNSLTPSGNPEGAAGMLRKWAKEAGATVDDQPRRARKAPTAPPLPPPIPGAIPPPPPSPSATGNTGLQGYKPGFPTGAALRPSPGANTAPKRLIEQSAEHRAQALPYLEKRGITTATAERFKIGYAEHFELAGTREPRIIIPYPGAEPPYFVARRLSAAGDKDGKKYLYPPKNIAGDKPLFNLPALTSGEKAVFITEGQIDAMTLEQQGGAAVASNEESQIINAIRTEKDLTAQIFIIIPDDDRTGKNKAFAKIEALKKAGFQAYIYRIPEGYHDVNDFFLKAGADAFAAWIASAKCPLLQYCVDFADVQDDPPELPPLLIHDILRCGEKMLISGPSKAGKTWFLIQMALDISTGHAWYGYQCEKAPILYLNLELKTNAFRKRIIDVSQRLGLRVDYKIFHVVNLCDLEKQYKDDLGRLIFSIIELARAIKARAIFIDPIYKCGLEDENSAKDVSKFCRLLDEMTDETGAAVIYCHHFSKGLQYEKNAIDRASGSGVFARDADAIVTLSELEAPDGYRIEATLRGFKRPGPLSIRFEHPLHVLAPELNDCPLKGSKPPRQGKGTGRVDYAVLDDASKKVILDEAAKICPCKKTAFVDAIADRISQGKNRAGELVTQMITAGVLICTRDAKNNNTKMISIPPPEPDEADEEPDEEPADLIYYDSV